MSDFVNPISPAMHSIPSKCPICDRVQITKDGIQDSGPYSDTESGIEDLKLADGSWTVAHVGCKYWFRDMVVNSLGQLFGDSRQEDLYDRVHEAIRDNLDMEGLVASLGPDFVRNLPEDES